MSKHSNVQIISNVFPVTTINRVGLPGLPIRYRGVCDDTRFLRQVRGKDALKKLALEKFGQTIYERDLREDLSESGLVEEWQIKVFWDQQGGGGCVDCPAGARPFGIVRRGGRYVVENRCGKPSCRCR
jgi:hypothetical protein